MHTTNNNHIESFWVAGINYKKNDTCVRGLFAINPDQYDYLLSIAPDFGVKELFVLSTCNRTEIYGVAEDVSQLGNLLCSVCEGDAATFAKTAYRKNGDEAMQHLFQVAAGLDSQILGDFEILGQIKTAVKQAKAKGFIGTFMERLLNSVMQSSKAIKTNTALSGGTVSVSFAAVQYIKEHIENIKEKKIVLVGTGKIGKSTCRNLIHYLNTQNIVLINRTKETATTLAGELGLKSAPMEDLQKEIADASVIIVSTSATEPVIVKDHLEGFSPRLLIDLSVPCNVAPEVATLTGVSLLNVDTLSKIKDETLENRKQEVPKAVAIISEHVADFKKWHEMRRHVPILKEVKSKLQTIHIDSTLLHNVFGLPERVPNEDMIQGVINVLATRMRKDNAAGCHYIEAINEYIAHHA